VVVSGYVVFLAVSAVLLFLFLVLVVVGGMIVAGVHLVKAYTVRQQCSLIRHGYDIDRERGAEVMTRAVRSLDGDRRWGPRRDQDVAQRSMAPDDSLEDSSARTERSRTVLPALIPPPEEFSRRP
jgi:uncharacterized membrane protein